MWHWDKNIFLYNYLCHNNSPFINKNLHEIVVNIIFSGDDLNGLIDFNIVTKVLPIPINDQDHYIYHFISDFTVK